MLLSQVPTVPMPDVSVPMVADIMTQQQSPAQVLVPNQTLGSVPSMPMQPVMLPQGPQGQVMAPLSASMLLQGGVPQGPLDTQAAAVAAVDTMIATAAGVKAECVGIADAVLADGDSGGNTTQGVYNE